VSDETTNQRHDMDPAAQVASELRARLRGMPQADLVEMAAQLLTTYVVESVVPLARAGEGAPELAQDAGGEESFAQMLKRFKASKRDPILEKFMIDGENISVRIDGYGTLPLTEYRRPNTPVAPGGVTINAQPRQERIPGASTSIYNRALYQPEAAPAGPASGGAPRAARGAPPAPILPNLSSQPVSPAATPASAQPNAPQQPGQKKDESNKADRFALIELD
jgi:hypothetical protein